MSTQTTSVLTDFNEFDLYYILKRCHSEDPMIWWHNSVQIVSDLIHRNGLVFFVSVINQHRQQMCPNTWSLVKLMMGFIICRCEQVSVVTMTLLPVVSAGEKLFFIPATERYWKVYIHFIWSQVEHKENPCHSESQLQFFFFTDDWMIITSSLSHSSSLLLPPFLFLNPFSLRSEQRAPGWRRLHLFTLDVYILQSVEMPFLQMLWLVHLQLQVLTVLHLCL